MVRLSVSRKFRVNQFGITVKRDAFTYAADEGFYPLRRCQQSFFPQVQSFAIIVNFKVFIRVYGSRLFFFGGRFCFCFFRNFLKEFAV